MGLEEFNRQLKFVERGLRDILSSCGVPSGLWGIYYSICREIVAGKKGVEDVEKEYVGKGLDPNVVKKVAEFCSQHIAIHRLSLMAKKIVESGEPRRGGERGPTTFVPPPG